MRNFTRYHLPSKEFSKIVRFNGHDYLLRSVYDDTIDQPKIDIKDTELKELPWFSIPKRRHRKINESFFDDLDDLEDEITQYSDEDSFTNTYTIYTKSGEMVDIQLSNNDIKNALFCLFVNIIEFNGSTDKFVSVDDFISGNGKTTATSSFKMKFSSISFSNGSFRIVIDDSTFTTGLLQAYFIDSHNIEFMIKFPSISCTADSNFITLTYKQFCDIISNDRLTARPKDAVQFYNESLEWLFSFYKKKNVNITICKPKTYIDLSSNQSSVDGAYLAQNFTITEKIPFKELSADKIMNYADTEDLQDLISNEVTKVSSDEYYVLIGGNDAYISKFISSVWFKQQTNLIKTSEYEIVIIKAKSKQNPNKIETHYMLLVPMLKFIHMTPALILNNL